MFQEQEQELVKNLEKNEYVQDLIKRGDPLHISPEKLLADLKKSLSIKDDFSTYIDVEYHYLMDDPYAKRKHFTEFFRNIDKYQKSVENLLLLSNILSPITNVDRYVLLTTLIDLTLGLVENRRITDVDMFVRHEKYLDDENLLISNMYNYLDLEKQAEIAEMAKKIPEIKGYNFDKTYLDIFFLSKVRAIFETSLSARIEKKDIIEAYPKSIHQELDKLLKPVYTKADFPELKKVTRQILEKLDTTQKLFNKKISFDHVGLESLLLDYTDHEGNNLLLLAVEENKLDVVNDLLNKANFDVNQKNKFGESALNYAVFYYRKYYDKKNTKYGMVETLLDHGALFYSDRDGYMPIDYAVRLDNLHHLLDLFLSIPERRLPINQPNSNGLTPLLSLLNYPNENNRADVLVLEALDKLLGAGAAANAVDSNGYSALFYARTFPQFEKIVSVLTRDEITHRSLDGKSAMHVLTINLGKSNKLPQALKILMKNGLGVDDLDGEEMTPLLYAIDLQNVAATKFLLSHGADPNHVSISGLGVYHFIKDNDNFAEMLYHLMEAGLTPTIDFLGDAKFVKFFSEYLAFKKYSYLVLVDQPRKKNKTEYLKKIGYPIELVDLVDKDSHNVSISPSIEELERGRILLEKRDYSGYLDQFTLQSKRLKPVEWSKKVIFDAKSELNRIERLIRRDNQVTLKPVTDKKMLDHISNLFISGSGPRPELFRVVGIYQIANRYLTEKFNSRKTPSNNLIEVWHGTNANNILSILHSNYKKHGDPGYRTATDTWFGQGVYFAPEAFKSLWYSDKLRDSCEKNIKSVKTAYIILNTVDLGPDASIWHVPPKKALNEKPIPSNYTSVYIHGGHKSITGVDRDEFVIGKIDHVLPTYLLKIACSGGAPPPP